MNRVGKFIEQFEAYEAAVQQRHALLSASGLPECHTRAALQGEIDAAVVREDGMGFRTASEALGAHLRGCSVCRAREEYLARHAPPLPDFPEIPDQPTGFFDWLWSALERLPGPLRVPKDTQGDARRAAVVVAVCYSAISIVRVLIAKLFRQVSEGWNELLAAAVLMPLALFVGFFLAGWVLDAARPWKDRVLVCIGGGAAAATAISVPIVAMSSLMGTSKALPTAFQWLPWSIAVGGVIGLILWLLDRFNEWRGDGRSRTQSRS